MELQVQRRYLYKMTHLTSNISLGGLGMTTFCVARITCGILLLTGPILSPSMMRTAVAQQVPMSRKQIAVIDFNYSNSQSTDDESFQNMGGAQDIRLKLVEALQTDKTYQTVNNHRIEQTLKALNLSSPLSSNDAIKVGKALGADIVLTGTITKFEISEICSGPSINCAPEVKAHVVLETNAVETASGKVANRRSDASMTRRLSSGSRVSPVSRAAALDEVLDQAINNLIKGLANTTDHVKFRRRINPKSVPEIDYNLKDFLDSSAGVI